MTNKTTGELAQILSLTALFKTLDKKQQLLFIEKLSKSMTKSVTDEFIVYINDPDNYKIAHTSYTVNDIILIDLQQGLWSGTFNKLLKEKSVLIDNRYAFVRLENVEFCPDYKAIVKFKHESNHSTVLPSYIVEVDLL